MLHVIAKMPLFNLVLQYITYNVLRANECFILPEHFILPRQLYVYQEDDARLVADLTT